MLSGLYMDVHVPSAITHALARRGVDVVTSQQDGTRKLDDTLLLQRATVLKRVLVTQDEDFLSLAAEWQAKGIPFTGIAFAAQMRTSIGQLIEDLELLAHCAEAEEVADKVIFLPLQ